MTVDKAIHDAIQGLPFVRWRPTNVHGADYYYAEGRVYVFRCNLGTERAHYRIAMGGSPDDAMAHARLAGVVDSAISRETLLAELNRRREEVGRLRYAVKLLEAAAGPYCAPELRPRLIAEARAELAEKADAEAAEGESHA